MSIIIRTRVLSSFPGIRQKRFSLRLFNLPPIMPSAHCHLPHAATTPSSNRLRSSARGRVMRSYSLGRRFTTRGSTRSGRSGLTTSLHKALPCFADLSQRTASMKLNRPIGRGLETGTQLVLDSSCVPVSTPPFPLASPFPLGLFSTSCGPSFSENGYPTQCAANTCRPRSDRFWLLELRVSRTFLDNLRSICSDHGYPNSTRCQHLPSSLGPFLAA